MAAKIKRDDTVQVLQGRDRGRRGRREQARGARRRGLRQGGRRGGRHQQVGHDRLRGVLPADAAAAAARALPRVAVQHAPPAAVNISDALQVAMSVTVKRDPVHACVFEDCHHASRHKNLLARGVVIQPGSIIDRFADNVVLLLRLYCSHIKRHQHTQTGDTQTRPAPGGRCRPVRII